MDSQATNSTARSCPVHMACVHMIQTVYFRAPGVVVALRLFWTSTATKTLGLVGQRPQRPVPGGQRRVVSRLGVLDLLLGILKFPLQVRLWSERIGNGCRFAALQRRIDPTTFYHFLSG